MREERMNKFARMVEELGYDLHDFENKFEAIKFTIYNNVIFNSDIVTVDNADERGHSASGIVLEKRIVDDKEPQYKKREFLIEYDQIDSEEWIPVNNIKFEILERIYNRLIDTVNTFPISNDTTWGWEIEGGSLSYHEDDIRELAFDEGYEVHYDCTAEVYDAMVDEQELVVDGYFQNHQLERGINSIFRVTDRLDWVTSEYCGFHIHVGNLNPETALKILALFIGLDDTIYDFLDSCRQDNSYSRKPSESGINTLYQKIINSHEDIIQVLSGQAIIDLFNNNRNHISRTGLNFNSYLGHRGTVEFRCFDSNIEFFQDYVKFTDAFVAYCQKNSFNTIKQTIVNTNYSRKNQSKFDAFKQLAEDIKLNDDSKITLLRRINREKATEFEQNIA